MIMRFFSFIFTTGVALVVMFWAIGFASYMGMVTSYTQPEVDVNMMRTNAVVVLTGGSERLQAGANLLLGGKGEMLLITGVHPKVKASLVLKDGLIPPRQQECCVTLGRNAPDTYGNARETKEFLTQHNYKTMTLVTAHYHMPRSLLVFKRQMPDVTIVPYPVVPASVNLTEWWRHTGTLMLLIEEYSKYALVWLSSKIEAYSNV